MLRYFLIIVLVGIFSYGLVEAWPLVSGPSLTVASPEEYASYPTGVVSVSGTVTRAALFTIDGMSVLHDENGYFGTTLTFPRGGSILTFKVTDRFGRTVAVTRNIFVP